MNKKHLACLILVVVIAVVVQLTLWMNQKKMRLQGEAEQAKTQAFTSANLLVVEKGELAKLEGSARPLIDFLDVWQPFFDANDSAQSAELKVSLRVKEDSLVSLSQKYEVVSNHGNQFLPTVMRSQLTFEDDYSTLLNWLGQVEAQLPTLRTSSVRLSRGTGDNDLKMEVVLEQPLIKK